VDIVIQHATWARVLTMMTIRTMTPLQSTGNDLPN
jgi:hypothetical protein